ncbi:hypothetical protein P175DRAFT_0402688, partial [Aspergillus ochraceoroseus IBT 24754]
PRLPNGQQPRKLRDSCIHCANSKVKCNKEKPVCGRCVRRRLICEYKVSRRTGRTSRTTNQISGASTASSKTNSTTATSPTSHTTNIDACSGVLSAGLVTSAPSQTPLLTPSTTLPTAHSSPEHCPPHTPDIWRSILSPSALGPDVEAFSSLMPMGVDVGDIFASVIPSPQLDACDLDALPAQGLRDSLSIADQPLFPAPGLVDAENIGFSSPSLKPPTCCLTVVLNILTNLFPNAPTACRRPGNQPGPSQVRTIESVISQNKEIIDTINTILDCPCSQDEYVISIVSLAVFKLMGWYVAAARDSTSTFEDMMGWGTDFTTHLDRSSPASFHEQVLHLPTVVGNYCIEGNDQSRMAAQLVLSELHRVQRLVNVLSARLESIRQRTCLSSNSISSSNSKTDLGDISLHGGMRASPFSGPTFSQLEEDLRKRLRAISSETIEILRRA